MNSSNKCASVLKILKNFPIYVLAVLWLYPFFLLFTATFRTSKNLFDFMTLPDFLYFENYINVFKRVNIIRPFLMSLILTVSTMAVTIAFASMAGYSLGRSKEKTFSYIYLLFASGLIIPAQSSMIPIYKLGVWTGLIGTIPFMVLIYVSGLAAYAALIYAGFTKNIPKELEEAAIIDGCGPFMVYIRIIFPLLLPATGTILATTTFWVWNDFQGPLIYLNNEKYYTLVMMTFKFQNQYSRTTEWGSVFVFALIVSLPMIVFFLFIQKHTLKGLVIGAIKG